MLRSVSRIIAFLLLVPLLSGCGEGTGMLDPDSPFQGTWAGNWTRDGRTGSLTMTVDAQGNGTATGNLFYNEGLTLVSEGLEMRVDIAPDGSVEGSCTLTIAVQNLGTQSGTGPVQGTMDTTAAEGTGSASPEVTGEVLPIIWTLQRSEGDIIP